MSEAKSQLADAHIHLLEHGFHASYGEGWAARNEVELYEALRAAHKIERSLVVGIEGDPRNRGNNSYILEAAKARPWIVPLAYQAVDHPPTATQFEELRTQFRGLALYGRSEEEVMALSRWPSRTIEAIATTGSIVSLNVPAYLLPILDNLFASMNGATIMLSHMGLPGRRHTWPAGNHLEAIKPVLAASRYENVGVKISGLYGVSDPPHNYPHPETWPILEDLRISYGARRLYWGSDFSPSLEFVSFVQTQDVLGRLEWPEQEVDDIMGHNLLDVLNES